MSHRRSRLTLAIIILSLAPLAGAPARLQEPPKRPLDVADIAGWKSVSATVLSNDGQWFAYRRAPLEGNGEVVLRNTQTGKELRFDLGEVPRPAGYGPPSGGASTAIAFADDSRWAAFTTYPSQKEADRLERQHRPRQNGATLVNLTTGETHEYPKVRRFAFSSGTPEYFALHRYQPEPPGGGGNAPARGRARRDRPRGADLVLRNLAAGTEENIGNVADFAFTKDGRRIAFTIDAQDQVGNGIQVRDLQSRTQIVLDSGAANYERPTWTEQGTALAVLKGTDDKAYRDKRYAVLGFTGLDATPKTVAYDPAADTSFPEGMTISPSRDPQWSEDAQAIFFGIHELRAKDPGPAGDAGISSDDTDAPGGAEDDRPRADDGEDKDKVDLVLWHWKDRRLPTQQLVQESRDRAFSYLAEYRVEPARFIRVADDHLRDVDVASHDRWAIGRDDTAYERMGNLDGRRYDDIYVVDLTTGGRTLAVKQARWYSGPSPDGRSFLYYDDGNYYVYSMEAKAARNITAGAPVSFVNTEDDHNVVEPPVSPVGWTSDSKSVLLSDNWDVWRVPVEGGDAVNLTVNGRRDRIRYRRRYALEMPRDREKGIDLSHPVYFQAYGEWTKKAGIARVDAAKPGATVFMWGDASFGDLLKAKDADRFVYSRETAIEPEGYYAAGADFASGTRLIDGRPQQAPFAWSSGSILVNYTSDKGDKLQAALFLPANYEKGRAYPTVVQIYERLSQGANTFGTPRANGFDRSLYTSHGYAVLQPDITYRVNDPGMSAVWCVVPAVKAAIATGIVDPKRVGLTGHSWGGYQTAFLVTQTDIFAAAVAGAPLTDMISMYSLVYKNSGGTNQAIFESSQGRFKGGYWDNWDAYYRNSPVFFASNVHTPLMILHNDKDGAVDFTQGVEYFNTLRRLQKRVVMLEYPGENHGLRRPANQRDYTVRMMEFFDHYLKEAPAPDWLANGVPVLEMEQHLKDRAAKPKPAPKKITTEG